MNQNTDTKKKLTTLIIYVISNFIFLSYGSVVMEFYRNLLLLSLPPVICVLMVFWLVRKNKISLSGAADLNSFQQRLFVVTGFAIGTFVVYCVIYFFTYG
jgi:hypothetical protein